MASVYHINKGINRPIVFKGLKGQYIAWLAISLVLLFLSFAVLYILGVSLYLALPLILGLGIASLLTVVHLNRRFGVHGLSKYLAHKRLPVVLKFRSRRIFTSLKYPQHLFKNQN